MDWPPAPWMARAGHELELQRAIRAIRERAIDESKKNIKALKLSRTVAQQRETYYLTREAINTLELAEREHMNDAKRYDKIAGGFNVASGVAAAIPDITLGISGWGA